MVIVSSIEELGYISSLGERASDLLDNLREEFISKFGVEFFSQAVNIIILSNDDFFHIIKQPSGLLVPYEPISNLSNFIQS